MIARQWTLNDPAAIVFIEQQSLRSWSLYHSHKQRSVPPRTGLWHLPTRTASLIEFAVLDVAREDSCISRLPSRRSPLEASCCAGWFSPAFFCFERGRQKHRKPNATHLSLLGIFLQMC